MIQYLSMDSLLKKYLNFKFQHIKWGEIKVNFKNSYEKVFKAHQGDLASNIVIKDNTFFSDVFLKGELGFAESYINNKWETSNLTNLLKILLKNQQIKRKNWADSYLSLLIEKFKFLLKANSINQAKKNIYYHYDLGNKFYSFWLDKSMTYSSGIFNTENDDLFASQINKYDNIIKSLDIETSLKDYRKLNLSNTYDKIVSIEMFEAVGKKYWDLYFKILNNALKKNGKACFQVITIDDKEYENYINQVDFIQKYIFPGGILPSKKILYKLFKDNNFELYEEKSFGNDYAKTLKLWKESFNNSWDKISKLNFDNKFKNLWNYYLSYCETGFATGHTNVSQFFVKKIA